MKSFPAVFFKLLLFLLCIIIFSWWTLTSFIKRNNFKFRCAIKTFDVFVIWAWTEVTLQDLFWHWIFAIRRFPEIYLIFFVIVADVALNLSNDDNEPILRKRKLPSWEIEKKIIYQNFLHSILTFTHAAFKRHNGI